MARNGLGTYSLPTGNPFVTGTSISSSTVNNTLTDIATALTGSLAANGETPVTANLQMDSFKLTGLAAGSARTDSANVGNVQDGVINWIAGGGTADAITANYSPPITALLDGQRCYVRATAANVTTTPTFSPNSLTAHTITQRGGQALVAGNIYGVGHELELIYNLANTRWELLNPNLYGVTVGNITGNLTGNVTGNTSGTAGDLAGTPAFFAPITNSLNGGVSFNTSVYVDGPSVAQGTSGKWFVCGTLTVVEIGSSSAIFKVKLWDGVTVISSGVIYSYPTAGGVCGGSITLSGYINAPAGNLRISAIDATPGTSAAMQNNASGNGKDSTITAIRIG